MSDIFIGINTSGGEDDSLGYTKVFLANSAEYDGIIDTAKYYLLGTAGYLMGTFSGSNPFTCRDYVTAPSVAAWGWVTLTGVDIEAEVGDYWGTYTPDYGVQALSGGTGWRGYRAGNHFTDGAQWYTGQNGYMSCSYGTGKTVEAAGVKVPHYYQLLMAGGIGRC